MQLKKASKKIKDKDASGLMDVDDEERDQMEALAKKFEEKYVSYESFFLQFLSKFIQVHTYNLINLFSVKKIFELANFT